MSEEQKQGESPDTGNSIENSTQKAAEWLKPYHFQKGVSGNPSGRPKKPITDAYQELAEKPYPGDPENRTYAQRLAASSYESAIVKGNPASIKEITDRLEGKVGDASSPGSPSAVFTLTTQSVELYGEAQSFLEQLRDRRVARKSQ